MGGSATTLHLRLRNEPKATRKLREAVERVAGASSLSAEARFDLKLAATEALANALEGAPGGHAVEVSVSGTADAVDVEVTDSGRFLPRSLGLDDRGADAEGGRGIPLMLALVDEIEFESLATGTRVRMRKHVPPE